MEPKAAETALVPRTVEEERALLEKQRLKTERKQLRRAARAAELEILVSGVMHDAGKHVALKRHMFKTDEELITLGLTKQERDIVRQWEVPKKSTAFGVESSAKLIEARTRAQAEKTGGDINVEKMIIKIPTSKAVDLPAPIYVDVEAK